MSGASRGGERGARWSTRARLTALIAAALVGGGALLLGTQYLVVQQVLTSAGSAGPAAGGAMDTSADSAEAELQAGEPTASDGAPPPEEAGSAPRMTAEAPAAEEAASEETAESFDAPASDGALADRALPRIALWSALALAVFSGLAILVARWLSRRSFRRIAQITGLAQRITAGDLDERIDLGGRRDEVRELADTIDGMLDRLQESFARQERFVANASHELRTPLTTTRTALEIPLAQGRIPEALEPAIRRALAANAKSERLIAALLALVRVRRGEVGAAPERGTDLVAAVGAALEAHAARTAELGLAVDLELREELPVRADPALLELAVGNLVGNAVRHNARGGRVGVSAEAGGGTVRLRIENTGAPLDERTLSAMAEPFNRGDATRLADESAEPGLGLGLTLADEAARAWGGSLALAPRAGGGLVAVLTLPRAR
ncbi:ATP-binding protein [Leucobacter sp.]